MKWGGGVTSCYKLPFVLSRKTCHIHASSLSRTGKLCSSLGSSLREGGGGRGEVKLKFTGAITYGANWDMKDLRLAHVSLDCTEVDIGFCDSGLETEIDCDGLSLSWAGLGTENGPCG
ncbi:hypothetical protein VNO78_30992 [Psophocarpus tetragonolobus]|uniref:Uncharacterized protein n=1 Tax=Psophocarpus tetragonolobus TaxID=3891 RepID=A0AAN9RXT6_PSOTE